MTLIGKTLSHYKLKNGQYLVTLLIIYGMTGIRKIFYNLDVSVFIITNKITLINESKLFYFPSKS